VIEPTGYRVRCEHYDWVGGARRRCRAALRATSLYGPAGLWQAMELDGWQHAVKVNGERARQGGRDYCPRHRRPK